MSIPTKFNPMGARVCGGGNDTPPTPIEYKNFVQPVLLNNTTIDRTKPYSFGMSITDDGGNDTAWQAFDSDAMSMWQLIGTKPTASLTITFEHPVLIEEVQTAWEQPNKLLAFSIAGYDDEGTGFGNMVMAAQANARANSFPVRNPKEVKSVKISVAQQGSSVVAIKFVGKYNAIYDNQ